MKRFCLIAAAVALTMFAAPHSALAGGGHHHGGHHGGHFGGHHGGHHYGHHGLHFSLGHFSHGYSAHHYRHYSYPTHYRYSYPSYSYSNYSYPSYSYLRSSYPRYSYYRNRSCYSPTVIYSQTAPQVVVPPQQPAEQSEKPKVDLPPQPVPESSDPLPNPGSTHHLQGRVLFTSIPSTQPAGTSQDTTSFRLPTLDPRFSTLSKFAIRPIISDEETPWVVGEISPPEPNNADRLVDHSHSH